MVMIMLKMNRTSKLFNSLALVAVLTVSTAVCAMEPENPEVTVTKQSPVVVNEALMEKARHITREKVLENLYGYSDYYFSKSTEILFWGRKINKPDYEQIIYSFDEEFLNNPKSVPAFNKDILAFLKYETNPCYCNNENALDGVKEALGAAGITLDALLGKTADAEEIVKEESSSSEALEDNKSHKRHPHCIIS